MKSSSSVYGAPAFPSSSFLATVILILFAFFFLNVAWTSDDAMITYRSVSRFMQGGGLCWNPGERVEVFTHPLWFFCLCLVPGNGVIVWSYILSFCCVLAALGFLIKLRAPAVSSHWALILTLLFSKAFLEYSSSGLENPLSYALFGAFIWLFHKRDFRARFYLVAALLFLNRMDYALILAGPCLYAFWTTSRHRFRALLPGLALVAGWLLFSLFYFGYPLPNTFLAKVSSVIPPALRLKIAGWPFHLLAEFDGLSALLLAAGILLPFFRRSRNRLLSTGILLYFAYFLFVGGDFMAGRFFAVPVYIATAILLLETPSLAPRQNTRLLACAFLAIFASIATSVFHYPQFNGRDTLFGDGSQFGACQRSKYGIADERSFYYLPENYGLIPQLFVGIPRFRESPFPVVEEGRMGLCGFSYYDAYIIDCYALCSPYLSRVPPVKMPRRWIKPGHLMRYVPEWFRRWISGKSATVGSGFPDVDRYFEDVRLVTRGPLFSAERLRAIARVNCPTPDLRRHIASIFAVDADNKDFGKSCETGLWWATGFDAVHLTH